MMKWKPSIWVLSALWILSGLPAAAQTVEETFSEDISKFKITAPNSQWKFTPRSVSPGPIRATPRFIYPVNRFLPNVTVRVLALPSSITQLNQFVEDDLKEMPKEIEVVEKSPFSIEGWKVLRSVFSRNYGQKVSLWRLKGPGK